MVVMAEQRSCPVCGQPVPDGSIRSMDIACSRQACGYCGHTRPEVAAGQAAIRELSAQRRLAMGRAVSRPRGEITDPVDLALYRDQAGDE